MIQTPENVKQRISNALGLATRFAKECERGGSGRKRAFANMDSYLKAAERLCNCITDNRLRDATLRSAVKIREKAYRSLMHAKLKNLLEEANMWIDSGSIRVPERKIREAREVAESLAIDLQKEFGDRLKELEAKLRKIKH